MEFTDSIKNNYEFRRLYAKGRSAATSRLVLYCRRNRTGHENHLGITVGTKIGKAVVRNRIRRRLREIYRTNEKRFAPGYDIVIVARGKSRISEYRELEDDLVRLAGKLGLLADAI